MSVSYDHRNCQSLFGYAAAVHRRSGAICQLCGCGTEELSFDLWRQFTVEHLIGNSQHGYPKQIRIAVAERFPALSMVEQLAVARQIDEANTVSSCQFCNSTTSRVAQERSMRQLILETPGNPNEVLHTVTQYLLNVLEAKRGDVALKLEAVRVAFEEQIAPDLGEARSRMTSEKLGTTVSQPGQLT